MELSKTATTELRKILLKELGKDAVSFSEADLKDFGIRILMMTACAVKRRGRK